MPVIDSKYLAPWYFSHPHVSTIVPSMFRSFEESPYERERITLPDGDFLDLDWIRQGGNRLVILSHGLEGNSGRGYMQGTALHFKNSGWDVLAWNCRSCSGEINRLPRFYHHADTGDLSEVVRHAIPGYKEVLLVGYSMGGSISLNYLSSPIPSEIKGAVVFSVPVVLKSSVKALTKKGNGFYRKRFLKKLKAKMQVKARMFPDLIDVSEIDSIQYFEEFDERYTAPLHGFKSAEAFYDAGSTLEKLPEITRPVLIVNAINDPFLGEECYPFDICTDLPNIHLEAPKKGGHVGFAMNQKLQSYMDDRPLQFYNTHIS